MGYIGLEMLKLVLIALEILKRIQQSRGTIYLFIYFGPVRRLGVERLLDCVKGVQQCLKTRVNDGTIL